MQLALALALALVLASVLVLPLEPGKLGKLDRAGIVLALALAVGKAWGILGKAEALGMALGNFGGKDHGVGKAEANCKMGIL